MSPRGEEIQLVAVIAVPVRERQQHHHLRGGYEQKIPGSAHCAMIAYPAGSDAVGTPLPDFRTRQLAVPDGGYSHRSDAVSR